MSEVRSLVPHTVKVMALTATASDETIREIIRDVGMHNPALVQVSPDKRNLLFGVRTVNQLEKAFLPIINLLKTERLNFGRTIIFCQRQVDCGSLYTLFEQELGTEFTEPVGTNHSLPQYRLLI